MPHQIAVSNRLHKSVIQHLVLISTPTMTTSAKSITDLVLLIMSTEGLHPTASMFYPTFHFLEFPIRI